MSSRPRRSAARRATEAITDLADRDNDHPMTSRSRRAGDARGVAYASQGGRSPSPTSSPADSDRHGHSNAKGTSTKLRQATTGKEKRGPSSRGRPGAGEAVTSRRATRGPKKSYVVASDSDEDDEDEGEDEIEVGNVTAARDDDDEDDEDEDEDEDEDMRDVGDDDAEADEMDDMDVDAPADGDGEDAEADSDMDVAPRPPPTIKVSKPAKGSGKGKAAATTKSSRRAAATAAKAHFKMGHDDDDDLSDLDSDGEAVNETVEVAGGDEDAEADEDMDVEGGEIEVADDDVGEGGVDSDDDGGSRAETPDMSRMTARQRAKHGDASHEYLKLSDEVQVKKHFTAEELSMRRLEMARRRRNLSDKRNEEVKMETINKLLKKQAPKTNRRAAMLAGEDTPEERASPLFVRFVSNKDGNRIGIPDDMVAGPMAQVFGLRSGNMVEEVL